MGYVMHPITHVTETARVRQINVQEEELRKLTPANQPLVWQIPRNHPDVWYVVQSPLNDHQQPWLSPVTKGEHVPVLLLPYNFHPDGLAMLAFGISTGVYLPRYKELVIVATTPLRIVEGRAHGYVGVAFIEEK